MSGVAIYPLVCNLGLIYLHVFRRNLANETRERARSRSTINYTGAADRLELRESRSRAMGPSKSGS